MSKNLILNNFNFQQLPSLRNKSVSNKYNFANSLVPTIAVIAKILQAMAAAFCLGNKNRVTKKRTYIKIFNLIGSMGVFSH